MGLRIMSNLSSKIVIQIQTIPGIYLHGAEPARPGYERHRRYRHRVSRAPELRARAQGLCLQRRFADRADARSLASELYHHVRGPESG